MSVQTNFRAQDMLGAAVNVVKAVEKPVVVEAKKATKKVEKVVVEAVEEIAPEVEVVVEEVVAEELPEVIAEPAEDATK